MTILRILFVFVAGGLMQTAYGSVGFSSPDANRYRYRYRDLAGVAATTACKEHEKKATKGCMDAYFDHFGLPLHPLPQYEAYATALTVLQDTLGKAAVARVCGYVSELHKCVQRYEGTCVCAAVYKELYNMTDADAVAYYVNYEVVAYECEQHKILFEHYECMKSINMTSDLTDCDRMLKPTDMCNSYPGFIDCIASHYSKTCDPKTPAPMYAFMCAVEVAAARAEAPQCKWKLPTCPPINGAAATSQFSPSALLPLVALLLHHALSPSVTDAGALLSTT